VPGLPPLSAGRGIRQAFLVADEPRMIWPVAALAFCLLCFVVVYGTRLQARVERRDTNT
jgi:hypothetical protein